MASQQFEKIIKISLYSVIAIIVIGYALFANRNFLSGSEIVLTSHQDGQTVTESFITIEGKVDPIVWLKMNDGEILTNKENVFKESIVLAPGLNIIEFEAMGKFNRPIKELLHLTYAP